MLAASELAARWGDGPSIEAGIVAAARQRLYA